MLHFQVSWTLTRTKTWSSSQRVIDNCFPLIHFKTIAIYIGSSSISLKSVHEIGGSFNFNFKSTHNCILKKNIFPLFHFQFFWTLAIRQESFFNFTIKSVDNLQLFSENSNKKKFAMAIVLPLVLRTMVMKAENFNFNCKSTDNFFLSAFII